MVPVRFFRFCISQTLLKSSYPSIHNSDMFLIILNFAHIYFSLVRQPEVGRDIFIFETSRWHLDTPHSVGLLWRQRPLPGNTQHSQGTDIHSRGKIQTHHSSMQATADPRIRPQNRWNSAHIINYYYYYYCISQHNLYVYVTF